LSGATAPLNIGASLESEHGRMKRAQCLVCYRMHETHEEVRAYTHELEEPDEAAIFLSSPAWGLAALFKDAVRPCWTRQPWLVAVALAGCCLAAAGRLTAWFSATDSRNAGGGTTYGQQWSIRREEWTMRRTKAARTSARRDHIGRLAVVSIFTFGATLPVAVSSTSSSAATRPFTPQPVPSNLTGLFGVTCVDLDHCWSAGQNASDSGAIVSTTDGGEDWTTQSVPSGVEQLTRVTCVDPLHCWAVGSGSGGPSSPAPAIVSTTDGGATWVRQTAPSGIGAIQDITCVSTLLCWAVGQGSPTLDGVIINTTDGGTTWNTQGTFSSFEYMLGITCADAETCWAVGGGTGSENGLILATTDGGTDWNLQETDPATQFFQRVTCVNDSGCWAIGVNTIAATTTGGTSWSIQTSPSGLEFINGLSCVSTVDCWGSATTNSGTGAIINTSDGGATWSSQTKPSTTGLQGISCVDNSDCWAAGVEPGSPQSGIILSSAPAPTTTTASVNQTSITSGQSVTYSATVTSLGGAPTGTVSFTVGSTTLCENLSLTSGEASCSSTNAPIGANTVTATYSGDPNFLPSRGTTTITINQPPASPPTHGYWLVGSDGGIFTFGSAEFYGSTGSLHLQRPVVGIVPTSDHGGYWLDASDGGVFSYGDTQFYGSIPGLDIHPYGSGLPDSLDAPVVGMVPSANDGGYFMVGSDGGVFAFGDAKFTGSCPGIGGCSGAAVAVMPDATGNGYWVVTQTGHVYTFGDAPYYGAPGPQSVPVTSAVRSPNGNGYMILFANGAIASYGQTAYIGCPSGAPFGGLNPATATFTTADGGGYWVATANGSVTNCGDAPNDGSMAGVHLNGSIIAATGW
jgi:photosystem II stability/assembly factor-like uncharacterized protein